VKSNKDISDLIRENAHKLEGRPSKQAWERLENRLDSKNKAKTFSIRRYWSIAASVIGLVCILSAISFIFRNNTANQDMAMKTSFEPEASFVVEEMDITEEEQGFHEVVQYQRKYQDRLSNPIIEGPGKKLEVANIKKSTFKKLKKSTSNLSKQERMNQEAEKSLQGNCTKFRYLKEDKATIIFFDDLAACRHETDGAVQITQDVVIPWSNQIQIEKVSSQMAIQLLLRLEFLNECEVIIPNNATQYTIKLSRTEMEAYFSKTSKEMLRTWKAEKSSVITTDSERTKFFGQFGSTKPKDKNKPVVIEK